MEWVQGGDLRSWLAGANPSDAAEDTQSEIGIDLTAPIGQTDAAMPVRAGVDLARLLAASAQLAEGLTTLHAAGIIHRDLKPANVMVTTTGRVVLLDYGLSVRVGDETAAIRASGEVAGTIAFLAPETVRDGTISRASDCYALGVLLYRLASGEYPHPGEPYAQMQAKSQGAPIDFTRLDRLGNLEFSGLVRELLRNEPVTRPSARQAASRLSGLSEPGYQARFRTTGIWSSFVGRQPELQQLDEHLAAVSLQETARLVLVRGESGIGKTTMLRHWLARAEAAEEVFVLHSACQPYESLPYLALDAAMDELSDVLGQLAPEHRVGIEVFAATARLFPVLARLPELRLALPTDPTALAPQGALQRHADLQAWLGLLHFVARRRTLVLWIDDGQWGDADSAEPLLRLLVPNPALPTLVLVSTRPATEPQGDLLPALLQPDALGAGAVAHELALAGLDSRSSLILVEAARGSGIGSTDKEQLRDLAAQAGGNPYLLCETARLLQTKSPSQPAAPRPLASLDSLLQARIADLTQDEARLLNLAAIAIRPVASAVLLAAAALGNGGVRAMHGLTRTRMLRSVDRYGVQVFHDRLRQIALDGLGADHRVALYQGLATAAQADEATDPATLAHYFRGAGDLEKALSLTLVAAQQAIAALAFDRAVRLLDRAAQDSPLPLSTAMARLRAHALANAGFARKAAAAYLDVAKASDHPHPLADRITAAELLIGSGALRDGGALMYTLAADVGLPMPKLPMIATLLTVVRRIQLALRGVVARLPQTVQPTARDQIALCWTAAASFGTFDAPSALYFQTLLLQIALDRGTAVEAARALAMDSIYLGSTGRHKGWLTKVHSEMLRLENLIVAPADHAFLVSTVGYAQFLRGDFLPACEQFGDSERLFAAVGAHSWERDHTRNHLAVALEFAGDLRQARDLMTQLQSAYQATDAVGPQAFLLFACNYLHCLADDDPAAARAAVAKGLALWGDAPPFTHAYLVAVAQIRIELYEGNAAQAADILTTAAPTFARMAVFQSPRVMHRWLTACVALLKPDKAALRQVERLSRGIAGDGKSWGRGLADGLMAVVAGHRGDAQRRDALAHTAIEEQNRAGMRGFALSLARAVAQASADAGALASADAQIARLGVVNPQRWSRVYAPDLLGR